MMSFSAMAPIQPHRDQKRSVVSFVRVPRTRSRTRQPPQPAAEAQVRLVWRGEQDHRRACRACCGSRPVTGRVPRPTASAKALFSALATWTSAPRDRRSSSWPGSALDLYAGSGAIRAGGRQPRCDQVVLVENHRSVVEVIRRNISATGLADRVQVRPMGVEHTWPALAEQFDIVVVDLPYGVATEVVDSVLARLADGWLAARWAGRGGAFAARP